MASGNIPCVVNISTNLLPQKAELTAPAKVVKIAQKSLFGSWSSRYQLDLLHL
ncbi:hypothetical protein [Umezakia ovalisporum]|jgi:hypothetical protein|uniref:Uncharacterized protein n=1 Tax=Umezakia ovalisporum FSS-43 TaxID=2740520 RepID=A0ABT6K8T6_9CYAN|nr:hypothetical protein [Umezakia ovalisporum]MDH6058742.1 hypothetical protein [Umezakia ovalisporum FSS-43]MDH6066608.1 hypothetical protein [Umezakia ovalisporum APH033B]MDH6072256.1 hypothetical protein [Umezakia ovalisporum CobakiLakeA]MDH6072834.1 hypothetical protein [Umezakia ovalisporum CS-1034]MDH6078925.1 hypothetical protein [Umezakia ovalisporum FSS-45]